MSTMAENSSSHVPEKSSDSNLIDKPVHGPDSPDQVITEELQKFAVTDAISTMDHENCSFFAKEEKVLLWEEVKLLEGQTLKVKVKKAPNILVVDNNLDAIFVNEISHELFKEDNRDNLKQTPDATHECAADNGAPCGRVAVCSCKDWHLSYAENSILTFTIHPSPSFTYQPVSFSVQRDGKNYMMCSNKAEYGDRVKFEIVFTRAMSTMAENSSSHVPEKSSDSNLIDKPVHGPDSPDQVITEELQKFAVTDAISTTDHENCSFFAKEEKLLQWEEVKLLEGKTLKVNVEKAPNILVVDQNLDATFKIKRSHALFQEDNRDNLKQTPDATHECAADNGAPCGRVAVCSCKDWHLSYAENSILTFTIHPSPSFTYQPVSFSVQRDGKNYMMCSNKAKYGDRVKFENVEIPPDCIEQDENHTFLMTRFTEASRDFKFESASLDEYFLSQKQNGSNYDLILEKNERPVPETCKLTVVQL